MTFVNPHLLYLLLIIPVLIFWYIYRLLRVHPTLLLPSLSSLEKHQEVSVPISGICCLYCG